jgi:hypothetical protein
LKIFINSKELIDTETEFYIRNREDLDDFLYERSSSFVKKEAAKLFDHIEMVFVAGDSNLHPWSPKANKVKKLIK